MRQNGAAVSHISIQLSKIVRSPNNHRKNR